MKSTRTRKKKKTSKIWYFYFKEIYAQRIVFFLIGARWQEWLEWFMRVHLTENKLKITFLLWRLWVQTILLLPNNLEKLEKCNILLYYRYAFYKNQIKLPSLTIKCIKKKLNTFLIYHKPHSHSFWYIQCQ